jgi:hypothetical protein
VLSYIAERGDGYFPNQTVNGLLNRLLSVTDPTRYSNLVFDMKEWAPYNPWVHGATFIFSSVILLAAIVRRSESEDSAVDYCRMAVSLTIASPVAWEHHYGILLPVFVIVLARTFHDRTRMIWLMASYVLVSNFIPATNLLAPTYWNIGQSYLLAGALILLVLLYGRRTTPVAYDDAGTGEVRGRTA